MKASDIDNVLTHVHTHMNINLSNVPHPHTSTSPVIFEAGSLTESVAPMCDLLHGFQGSKFRSSFLHSRYFVNGVICPDHFYILKILVFKFRAPQAG